MTDDLITWLRAQLDNDEAYARNAFGDHNDAGPEWREEWSGALNIGDTEDLILTNDSQVSRFMARFDPARVLAEVDAKRRILDELATQLNAEASDLNDFEMSAWVAGAATSAERLLQLLALPYADRPGYRDEWKP